MKRVFLFLAAAALVLWGTTVSAQNDGAEQASAVLRDAGGTVVGFAFLTEDATGLVHVNVHADGISPGPHGIHLHAIGSCDGGTVPPFASAGGHFNPAGTQHGLANPAGPHAGDLPNLTVNSAGVGHLNASSDRVTLSAGPRSLFDADGSALVVHAAPDDQVTDPSGNSGGRIACGVIERD